MSEPGGQATAVLLVCTGRICTSLVVETFLRRRLAGLESDVVVQSAALRSEREAADPVVVKMLRRRGFRPRGHRSATLALTPALLSGADLVLSMATEHVEAVVAMAPETWPRVFTLKELIRRSNAVGGRRSEETVDDWLARLHSGRVLGDSRRSSPQDDLADPIGQPLTVYENMANEVEALTTSLADSLTGTQGGPAVDSAIHVIDAPQFEPGSLTSERGPWVDLDPEGKWSVAAIAQRPAISFEGIPTGNGGRPLEQGPETNRGISPDYEVNPEETSLKAMKEEDVDPDGARGIPSLPVPPVEGQLTAQEALWEAQQTLTEAAQQLAEVLRSATDTQQNLSPDAYTQLGDEVAAVMRSAAAQSSVLRDDAHRVRSQAEADAGAVRDQAHSDASDIRQKAVDESAAIRREAEIAAKALTSESEEQAELTLREAASERQQASTEATDIRQAVTTETAELRDEADRYAKSTRQRAEADASHIRDEADRYARNVQAIAEVQITEVRDRAEHDAATMRHAAEDDARAMRSEAEQEATELVSKASTRYAELVVAEGEMRSRLEAVAGALVSTLDGSQHTLSPPPAPAASDEEERD